MSYTACTIIPYYTLVLLYAQMLAHSYTLNVVHLHDYTLVLLYAQMLTDSYTLNVVYLHD